MKLLCRIRIHRRTYLWERPNCMPCKMTKRTLDDAGSTYTEHDVSADPDAAQRVRDLGYAAVPVVTVSLPDGLDQVAQQRRWKAWEANGKPCPPANTGGVLMRYFYADWDRMYFWASGKEPATAGKAATPPRPTFQLIHGEVS